MNYSIDFTPGMGTITETRGRGGRWVFEPPVELPDRAKLEVGDGFVLIDGERTDGRLELEE